MTTRRAPKKQAKEPNIRAVAHAVKGTSTPSISVSTGVLYLKASSAPLSLEPAGRSHELSDLECDVIARFRSGDSIADIADATRLTPDTIEHTIRRGLVHEND